MATLSTRNLPIPTLSISGSQGISNITSMGNVFNLNNWSGSHNTHPDVKKYEIYESPSDVLALSSAWKRMRDNGTAQGKISRLLDNELFQFLTGQDYEQANKIRDYYSKKIVMWKLKGERMSSYRNDLSTFVHSDGTKFREEMLGLAYYLPSFYEYDIQLDEVRMQVESNGVAKKPMINTHRTLTPIKKIVQKTKRISAVQYWMKDTMNDHAALIQIEAKNQLEHLWNYIFETSSTIDISGNFHTKQRDNFEYLSISNWELVRS